MQVSTTRGLVLALACLVPLGAAAHSAVASDDAAFEDSFSRYEVLPPAPEVDAGAVDIENVDPVIKHSQASDLGSGIASYYGRRFNGRRTASGEVFDMSAMTAAHRTLPFGSKVRVTNPNNGKSVIVRINDRGPYGGGRTIDVSRAAATELGLISRGHGRVELALLD